MKYIALAAALAALSFTAPAEAMTCKELSSKTLNMLSPYSSVTEYKWRLMVKEGEKLLTKYNCDPIGSGFRVGAAGMRVDVLLYGGPDPNGY